MVPFHPKGIDFSCRVAARFHGAVVDPNLGASENLGGNLQTRWEQTCPEIRNISRNKGLFLGYGAIWGDGISGRVFLFLDASSWSGRPGGRAGEQARASKIISGDVFLFLDASSWSGRPGGRAGGRAGGRGL